MWHLMQNGLTLIDDLFCSNSRGKVNGFHKYTLRDRGQAVRDGRKTVWHCNAERSQTWRQSNVLVVVGFYECLLFVHVSTTANCVMCLKVLVIQRDTFSRLSGLPSPEGWPLVMFERGPMKWTFFSATSIFIHLECLDPYKIFLYVRLKYWGIS